MIKFASLLFAMTLITGLTHPTKAHAGPTETAIFAGGCFWCLESDFEKLEGVISATSGYTGGAVDNPSYEQVSHGGTGHYEAVKVVYDPARLTYATLVDYFWRHIDPFDKIGQFCDKGDQYRAAVFYADDAQKDEALASKTRTEQTLGKTVVTEIIPAQTFYDAEGYHQDYYKKNPTRYKFYRWNCGRDQRVKAVWGANHP